MIRNSYSDPYGTCLLINSPVNNADPAEERIDRIIGQPDLKCRIIIRNSCLLELPETAKLSFINFKINSYRVIGGYCVKTVSYTHLRAHETDSYLVCRLL